METPMMNSSKLRCQRDKGAHCYYRADGAEKHLGSGLCLRYPILHREHDHDRHHGNGGRQHRLTHDGIVVSKEP